MDLHDRAQYLAKELLKNEAELIKVLIQMQKEKRFMKLEYSGVYNYVLNCLNLSEAQAYYYKKVVEKSIEVPALKAAVTTGELSLSKARRIVAVLDQANAEDWIQKAKDLNQKKLEAEVAKANPRAKVKESMKAVGPELVQVTIAVTPEVEALLRRVKELEAQRTKSIPSWNDVITKLAETYLKKQDPIKRADRVSSGKKPAPKSRPGRESIPAAVAHEVNLRDKGQCVAVTPNGVRCEQKQWLEMDHIITVADGGLNEAPNLRTLCNFHHRLRHSEQS